MRMKEIIKAQLSLEAATRGALQEMVFLEISQNSQENTCDRVSFVKFVKFLRTPFYRTCLDYFFYLMNSEKIINVII